MSRGSTRILAVLVVCVGVMAMPALATAATTRAASLSIATGGAEYGAEAVPAADPAAPVVPAQPTVPGAVAQIVDGIAYAPADAPDAVKQAIWAANAIVGKPYRYGGGHAKGFVDTGYDCSGTVSVALNGAGLLSVPRDSSSLLRWGVGGKGAWITVYTKRSHAFAVIAGIRLDTSAAGDPTNAKGPRWRTLLRSTRGYRARHALGL